MRCSSSRASRWASSAIHAFAIASVFAVAACSDAFGPSGRPTVSIVPPADSVFEGDVVRLGARFVDGKGHEGAGSSVAWSVSDATIASVDAQGMLTALRPGTVQVSARSGSTTGTYDLTIGRLVVQRIETLPPALELGRGDIVQLTVNMFGQGGRQIRSRSPAFTSDDPSVCQTNVFGQVRSVGPGSTFVRATADGVTTVIPVGVVFNDSTYALSLFNASTLPFLIAADSVTVNGVPEFHEVYIENGQLVLSGVPQLRYQLWVNYTEYSVVHSGTSVTREFRAHGFMFDRGLVTVGADGSLAMESEWISPLTHTATAVPDGFQVHFNLPGGDGLVWELTYHRVRP